MEIKYEIKGIMLDTYDLMELHEYYEAACTAEYLMENYNISDESTAIHLGYDVRRLMNKYGYDEEEAIDEVLSKEKNNMLPIEVYINHTDINEDWDEMDRSEQEEAMSNYLSDTYGFCHYYFEYEDDGEKIHITNITWDEEEERNHKEDDDFYDDLLMEQREQM